MQVEEVKKRVTFEILPQYVQSVHRCVALEDLAGQSKAMFKQIVEMVLPKFHVEYVPNDMPQDILNQEERKEQITNE